MSARSHIGPGRDLQLSSIRKNRDPGRLGIEPIPGIEPTFMKSYFLFLQEQIKDIIIMTFVKVWFYHCAIIARETSRIE